MYKCFACVSVFHVCTALADARRGHWIPLGPELQIVVNPCMGAGNQYLYLYIYICKNNKCS